MEVDEDTNLKYELITITPYKSTKLIKISMDLIDDSPFNIESEVNGEFGYKFGITEVYCFIDWCRCTGECTPPEPCGECEGKCPQNIEIIDQLKETHAALSE